MTRRTRRTWYDEHECAHGCCSIEETYAGFDRAIDGVGWGVMGVIGDERRRPWAYTVGLVESYDHPEFVVTGLEPEAAHPVLNILGEHVRLGVRYEADPGGSHEVHGATLRFVTVHRSHWRADRFNAWVGYYDGDTAMLDQAAAVQVLWPDRRGRFPNDPGGERLQVVQPMLIRPPAAAN